MIQIVGKYNTLWMASSFTSFPEIIYTNNKNTLIEFHNLNNSKFNL